MGDSINGDRYETRDNKAHDAFLTSGFCFPLGFQELILSRLSSPS